MLCTGRLVRWYRPSGKQSARWVRIQPPPPTPRHYMPYLNAKGEAVHVDTGQCVPYPTGCYSCCASYTLYLGDWFGSTSLDLSESLGRVDLAPTKDKLGLGDGCLLLQHLYRLLQPRCSSCPLLAQRSSPSRPSLVDTRQRVGLPLHIFDQTLSVSFRPLLDPQAQSYYSLGNTLDWRRRVTRLSTVIVLPEAV